MITQKARRGGSKKEKNSEEGFNLKKLSEEVSCYNKGEREHSGE